MMRAKLGNYPKDSMAVQFSRTINVLDLKSFLYDLTSDNMAGRETGYSGQKVAEKFLVSKFKSFGLKPADGNSYTQNFSLFEDTLLRAYIQVGSKKYQCYEDFYSFLGNTKNDSIDFDKILVAGYGIESENYSDYKNLDTKDAVVLIHSGEPMLTDTSYVISGTEKKSDWSNGWEKKINLATEKGVRAILIVVDNVVESVEKNHRIKKRPMYFVNDTLKNSKCNIYYIDKELAKDLFGREKNKYDKYISKMLANSNPTKLKLKIKGKIVFQKKRIAHTSSNVAAMIEGTEKKDEVIIISAHYDHLGAHDGKIYYGADDNGSGTTAVLELAKAFSIAQKKGSGPKRSILFLCVSGEEKGLLGSEYYTNNPLIPLENTIADLNIDMIGRVDSTHTKNPNYVYIIGDDKISTELHEINEKSNKTYLRMTLDYKYNNADDPNRFYYRSDHYNFAQKGIPVIFYFNGVHKDYHRATDTFEKINFGKMLNTVKLVYFTAWDLANRNERLAKDKR
jgi:hypothetical protein